jgi:putative peptidoglycan lipid II flippase
MIRAFLSVGFFTLLSRVTGFGRDVLLATMLGAGGLMDAFAVAFRLPNHFRAIFAEGAFNTAFVPSFTRIRVEAGEAAAALFQGRILSLVLASQLILLGLVLAFTPSFVSLLAPGFAAKGEAMALATSLTRLTFPYLALITLVVLWTGVLNATGRFAAGAAAPVLLNVAMVGTLLLSAHFATPAHAAASGVLIAGFLEAGLLAFAAHRAGLLARPQWPKLDGEVRRFFRSFGPAVIGAMLMDTILVTFLPQGGASALYYADRLYQLPVGVIGVAAGTVVLPEMAKRIAAGDEAGAHTAQNRALGLTLLLSAPFFIAFLMIPEGIVRAFFGYGQFTALAAAETGRVLAAYALGLPAILAIRALVASFYARGDTKTPLYASLTAIALNVLLKLVLWRDFGAAGLAGATAFGAWVNVLILGALAIRQGKTQPDAALLRLLGIVSLGMAGLAASLWALPRFTPMAGLHPVIQLGLMGGAGGFVYGSITGLGIRLARIPLRLKR